MPISQMDVGPMVPGACAVAGFIVIPLTLLAWFLLIRRKPRRKIFILFTIISTLLLAIWLAGLVDLQYEPSIDNDGARSLIENLPEVGQYIGHNRLPWPYGKSVGSIDGDGVGHWVVLTVGDFDKQGNIKTIWHIFRVHSVTGEINILVDDNHNVWMSLEAWRKRQAVK